MESDSAGLARAIAIAATAHADQIDKSGKPYILHPVRVMQRLAHRGFDVQMVAVLHDTVEDTWVTLELLTQMGFPPEVIAGVDAMTRRDGEDYFAYIERCGRNEIGSLVKLADLDDNCDPVRAYDGQKYLLTKYAKARAMILQMQPQLQPQAL